MLTETLWPQKLFTIWPFTENFVIPIPNCLILSDSPIILAITQLKTLCHYDFSFLPLPFLVTKSFCKFPSFQSLSHSIVFSYTQCTHPHHNYKGPLVNFPPVTFLPTCSTRVVLLIDFSNSIKLSFLQNSSRVSQSPLIT